MIDLPETESAQQQIPTEEEALRFLNYICNEEIEYRTYYVLAIYTGCRRGDVYKRQDQAQYHNCNAINPGGK